MRSIHKILVATVVMLAAVCAVHAADSNVTGTWSLKVETERGVRDATMVLTQTGQAVSGTYKGARGENPVTGTVKGDALTLTYKLALQGNEMEVTYTGTVAGNTMSGTVSMGPMGNGKFTGTKQ